MIKHRPALSILLTGFLLLWHALITPAQEKTGNQEIIPQFEKDISVKLRLVDVAAVGKDGVYVTDLKPEELTLIVDGQQRSIETFDVFMSVLRTGDSGEAASLYYSPPRSIVLFFDQAYSSFRGIRNAKRAASDFIVNSLRPGDKVMVLGYDLSLTIYQDFTSDRNKLLRAVDKINYSFAAESEDLKIIGKSIDTANIQDFGRNARWEKPSIEETPRDDYFDEFSMFEDNPADKMSRMRYPERRFKEFRIRTYLSALESVAYGLKPIRGRKTIVFLSQGFDHRIAITDLKQNLKKALEALNDSNSSMFCVDIWGLDAPDGMIEDDSMGFKMSQHESLSCLSTETGGKYYGGSNDISALLLSIDNDISHYYVLGFYLDETEDGRFRKVRIQTQRPGVKLLYRKGFYSRKTFQKLDKVERIVHLKEGFYRNSPTNELAAKFSVNAFPRDAGDAVAGILFEAPLSRQGKHEYEIFGYVFYDGDTLLDAFHKTFTFTPKPEAKAFHHFEHVFLREGENVIKLVIRDNATGKRAYQFFSVRMPEFRAGLLASTLLLRDPGDSVVSSAETDILSLKNKFDLSFGEPADPLSPLTRTGVRIGVTNKFEREKDVGIIVRIDGIDVTDEGPRLATKYILEGDDGMFYSLEEKYKQVFPIAGAKAAIVMSMLNIGEVPAGGYTLRARIDDILSGKAVGRKVTINLE